MPIIVSTRSLARFKARSYTAFQDTKRPSLPVLLTSLLPFVPPPSLHPSFDLHLSLSHTAQSTPPNPTLPSQHPIHHSSPQFHQMATIGNNNLNAKLVLLGDMGAGKSSLVLRFVKGQFLEFQESTIGAAFFSQTLAVNDATVKFEIWDTAGQERYHSLAPMYYRGAAAAIIVYDITSAESFTRAKKWVQELQKQGNPNMVMALAGNKADLEEKRKVTAEEARIYAEENGLFFMETSAKTANNVNDIFYEIARRLPRAQPSQNPTGMVLVDRPADRSQAAACCS